MKGTVQPDNKWLGRMGPGDYEEVDKTERAHRVRWPSVPVWSVPKGDAQETVREKQKSKTEIGPGSYELPSPFDMSRTKRLAAERRLLQKYLSRSQSASRP